MRPSQRAAVVEDVAWLAETGVKVEHWPARLGRTPSALARALYRAGRNDLANPVEAVARQIHTSQHRDEPCPECGGGVPRRNHTYCSRRCAGYAINRRRARARGPTTDPGQNEPPDDQDDQRQE